MYGYAIQIQTQGLVIIIYCLPRIWFTKILGEEFQLLRP